MAYEDDDLLTRQAAAFALTDAGLSGQPSDTGDQEAAAHPTNCLDVDPYIAGAMYWNGRADVSRGLSPTLPKRTSLDRWGPFLATPQSEGRGA
jgi:hypothetical protein